MIRKDLETLLHLCHTLPVWLMWLTRSLNKSFTVMMQRNFSSYSSQANGNRQDRVGISVSVTTDNVISSHRKRILMYWKSSQKKETKFLSFGVRIHQATIIALKEDSLPWVLCNFVSSSRPHKNWLYEKGIPPCLCRTKVTKSNLQSSRKVHDLRLSFV